MSNFKHPIRILLALVACSLVSVGALADKPDGAGHGGKHKDKQNHSNKEKHDDKRDEDKHEEKRGDNRIAQVPVGSYFVERQRVEVRNYYVQQYSGNKCPPGLAKKNNGCQPPGQAKKWAKGQPLPSTVVFYPVPQAVVVQMGPPPSGYQYVRVSDDLLLVTIGTRLVVDVIENLMRP